MAHYHWLPLNIGDYLGDTMHLSTLQHGVYIRLIMHYWKRRSLPVNIHDIARIAGMTAVRFRRVGAPVLELFTTITGRPATLRDVECDGRKASPGNTVLRITLGDSLRHKRLDAELLHAQVRSNAGKTGSDGRWGPLRDREEKSFPVSQNARIALQATDTKKVSKTSKGDSPLNPLSRIPPKSPLAPRGGTSPKKFGRRKLRVIHGGAS
jgi:uncharacterized protein YdaU (DUF1376 family)